MIKKLLLLIYFVVVGLPDALASDFTCKEFLGDAKNNSVFEKDIAYINGAADMSALWTTIFFQQKGFKINPLEGHNPKDSYKWIINYCVINPDDGVVVAVNKMVEYYSTSSLGSTKK